MQFTYTIEEVNLDSIRVRYQDGSYAIVPVEKTNTRQDIEAKIAQFCNYYEPFTDLAEIPFSAGDTGTITPDDAPTPPAHTPWPQLLTYQDLRRDSYPSIGDQLDALYWDRNANPEPLEKLDVAIAEVKEKFPKTMAPITPQQALEQYGMGQFATPDQLIKVLEA